MNPNEIPYLSATELGAQIQAREISPLEAVDAYLARIETVDTAPQRLHHHLRRPGPRGSPPGRRRNFAGRGSRPSPWRAGRGQGPDLCQGHPQLRRVKDSRGTLCRTTTPPWCPTCARGRGRHPRQAQHERIRHGRPHQFLFWSGPEPLGPGTQSGNLQYRLRGGHRRVPLRHVPGRGYRRVDSRPGGQLRAGRHPANLGGESAATGWTAPAGQLIPSAPISRTVADCAATIGAIAGYDPNDPYTGRVAVPDYTAALTGEIRGTACWPRFRVDGPGIWAGHPDPQRSGRRGPRPGGSWAQRYAKFPSRWRNRPAPSSAPSPTPSGSACARSGCGNGPKTYHVNTRIAFMTGNLIPGQVYYKAQKLRAIVRQQVLSALEDVDVLIQPTSSGPAGKLDFNTGVASKERKPCKPWRKAATAAPTA